VSDAAIELQDVGKRYWKLDERAMLLRSLLPFARPQRTEFWALRDIDLEIGKGDVVGVIGRNGAGKTTLLRMLAGVTRPTTGRLRVRGRVAPLISVGVGFHREMSGRENVYVNGMLLGLSKREVDRRFDAIVEFSELEDFIDTPVKFYSSGMFMRLGFAAAVHTDPEVLLVDEVLAVGDVAFQVKCAERMKQIREAGTTIVLVSHNLHSVRVLCPRAVVLNRGRTEFDGPVEGAIARHHEILTEEAEAHHAVGEQHYLGGVDVEERELLGPDGPTHYVDANTPMRLRLKARFDRDVDSPLFAFTILATDGTIASRIITPLIPYRRFAPGQDVLVELKFTARLAGGTYRIAESITTSDGLGVLYSSPVPVTFEVGTRHGTYGIADLDSVVTLDGVALREERASGLGVP
jgi:ABC-type polysaccharide/polyol phosphate transport system ATPase subunit